jgi:flavin reductase (DIM6/NTAB) family NADH-FMN oxidoreductase RutF
MHGVTVNSFSSVSLDPMLVLVCLNETSRAVDLIEGAGAFVVNVLSAGQQDVSRWFANQHRPPGPAMFDGVPLEPGVTGCPILADAAASFDCRLRQSYHAGTYKSLAQKSRRDRTNARRFGPDLGVPGQRPHRRAA